MSQATAALGTTLARGTGTPTDITLATSANSDDIIDTAAPHGFVAGDRIQFSALTGGEGVSIDTDYYVIATNLAAQTFRFSTSPGGSGVNFSTDITAGTVHKVTPVPIAQIRDISGPALSTDTDEITNHDSPGGVEEFIPTIKRMGEVTFALVFQALNATHDGTTGVIKAWSDRALDDYELRYPDDSGWDFQGYVTGFSLTAPVNGHVAADVTIRPSGEPTFVNGA